MAGKLCFVILFSLQPKNSSFPTKKTLEIEGKKENKNGERKFETIQIFVHVVKYST